MIRPVKDNITGSQDSTERRQYKARREDWETAKKVVTYEKIKWVINSFESYKSAGSDGIIPAMMQEGPDLLINKLTEIFRASLAYGYIPMGWRPVRVAFIPKPGKTDYSQAKSFRPISLMSFLLKTLEKLLDRHIRDGALFEKPLLQDQCAYTAGKSTETALHRLVTMAEKALETKEVLLAAFLDVEGAFDNTPFESITRAAGELGIDATSCRWIDCMLRSRIVRSELLNEILEAYVTQGCPQGGVLSPILWCMVMNGLLLKLKEKSFSTLGYADDLVILVQGKFNTTVRERMQTALDIVKNWTEREGLKISPLKSAIVPFTKRRKIEDLGPLFLHGKEIPMLGEIKYLGVILDSKLSWNQHLDKVTKRSESILLTTKRMHGQTWGLQPKMAHWIYTRVVVPTITYAALTWWPKTLQVGARLKLSKIQRLACLGITGAMKSTPTASMEALLNLPPLHLVIQGEAKLGMERMGNKSQVN